MSDRMNGRASGGAGLRIEREAASLRHQVEDALRNAIAGGQFAPGARLVERELCEMTGVSRPSIREALRRLEAEGLVHMVPHRGPMVAEMGIEEARQIYAVRALLEGFAAQEFARYATTEEVARLKDCLRAIEKAARPGGGPDLTAAKAQFYGVLLDGCRNDIVRSVLSGLLNRVNVLRMTSMSRKDRLPASLKELRELLARIVARDPEGARQASMLHIENAARVALDVLARREIDKELPAPPVRCTRAPARSARR